MKADILVFKIELLSGEFSSELRLPMPASNAEMKKTVERWLDFMGTGLRLAAERMDAVLERENG